MIPKNVDENASRGIQGKQAEQGLARNGGEDRRASQREQGIKATIPKENNMED